MMIYYTIRLIPPVPLDRFVCFLYDDIAPIEEYSYSAGMPKLGKSGWVSVIKWTFFDSN